MCGGHSWARPFLEEGVGRQLASASCREGRFPWALPFPHVELSVPRGKANNRDQPFLKQGSSPTSHLGLTFTSALPGKCGRHQLPLAVFCFPTSQDSEVMGWKRLDLLQLVLPFGSYLTGLQPPEVLPTTASTEERSPRLL